MNVSGKPAVIGTAVSIGIAVLGMWLAPVTVEIGKREPSLLTDIGYYMKIVGSIAAFLFISIAIITPRPATRSRRGTRRSDAPRSRRTSDEA